MATHPLIDEHQLQSAAHPHRDWPFRRSTVMRYGAAVLAVALALAIRYLIYGDLQHRLVFTFFVPAAIFAVWYGGMGPGILATVLGLLVGDYFFLNSRHAFWPLGIREALAVGAYTVTTLLCVILCETLHALVRQFEHALEQERHHLAGKLGAAAKAFIQFLEHHPSPAGYHAPVSWPFQRPVTARYGVAIAMVILAFVLRYWLFGTQDYRFPFIFFVPAAMIATWYGGMAPGLLATAAGLMLGDYFFLSSHEALGPVREIERVSIGMYAVTTMLCVMLFEDLHNRIRRLEHALERARHHRQLPHGDSSTPGSPAVTPSPH